MADARREIAALEAQLAAVRAEAEAGRREAARAAHRWAFLARASAALAASLDYLDTLRGIGELAVPEVADWCSVASVTPEGRLQRIAVVHRDPEKRALCEEYLHGFPPERHRAGSPMDVVKAGRAVLAARVDDAALAAVAQDEAHLRVLRGLGVSSTIMAPLVAHGELLGVLSLNRADAAAPYGEWDLALAEDLASRAALAVSNARLFEAERRARQASEEALQLRETFLSVAGHELRTPLTALQLHLEGLLRHARHEGLPGVVSRAGKALGDVARMTRLIDELLDVARLRAGRLELEPEPEDLARIVEEVVARLAHAAQEHGCAVGLALPPELRGRFDRPRVEQVLTNLLMNAFKYGRGKPVDVRLSRAGAEAVLEVVDQGIGVDLAHQRRIFERFERAVSARQFGGLGLGLWISREIVEASGGSIDVESAPGQGARFTVRLPLA